METMVEMWVWQQSGRHQGIEALRTLPTTQGGDRGPLGLPPHANQLWVVITTLSCAVGTNKSAPAGAFLTEMSDAGSFVGRFRSLLLQSADNAYAALIPGQTARQRVLKVRPAEADQDPGAVDGCLVCSCCSPSYA